MSGRKAKWERAGYTSQAAYKDACSRTAKIKNACLRATGATYSTSRVLQYLWNKAEYDRPEVTTTKPQICEDLRLDRKTVQGAFRFLKEEGTIVPIRGIYGGKNVPITFALKVPVNDKDIDPIEAPEALELKQREAAFKYLASKHGAIKAMEIMDKKKGEI